MTYSFAFPHIFSRPLPPRSVPGGPFATFNVELRGEVIAEHGSLQAASDRADLEAAARGLSRDLFSLVRRWL